MSFSARFLFTQKTKTKINMLSLTEFKMKLGATELSDKQLEDLENSLYAVVTTIVNDTLSQIHGKN